MSDAPEVEITGVAHGGHCVARHDGKVTFVRHALPGERVAIAITGQRAHLDFADAVGILAADPDRVTPPCPHSGPGRCGGCDWLHTTAERQVILKSEVATAQLDRLGVGRVDVVAVPPHRGWRTRMTLHVGGDGRAGLKRHASDDVEALSQCLQADARLAVGDTFDQTWPAGGQIRLSCDDSDRFLSLRGPNGWSRLMGPAEEVHTVGDVVLRSDPLGFWQSHISAPDVLTRLAAEWVSEMASDRLVDLYAGVGLFGVTLGAGRQVLMVEGNRSAVAFAVQNAAAAGVSAKVVRADVGRWLTKPRPAVRGAAVILDPPRAGLGKAAMAALCKSRPQGIVYVSCEVSTLARDLAVAPRNGYRIDKVRAFDLFPGTGHFETVALLLPADG